MKRGMRLSAGALLLLTDKANLGVVGQEVSCHLPTIPCLHFFAHVAIFTENPLGVPGTVLAPRVLG